MEEAKVSMEPGKLQSPKEGLGTSEGSQIQQADGCSRKEKKALGWVTESSPAPQVISHISGYSYNPTKPEREAFSLQSLVSLQRTCEL